MSRGAAPRSTTNDAAMLWAEVLALDAEPKTPEEVSVAIAEYQMIGLKIEDHVVGTLPDGRECRLQLMTFGHVRLYWGQPDTQVYDDDSGFCYEDLVTAFLAVQEWAADEYEGEPQGWYRHVATGRRRPEGDATKEYVRP